MKIAYVSDAIYPYNKGGKEKRLVDITTRLVALGHEVHVYCMKWWESPEKHRIERGVHLHAISPLYPLYTGERRSISQALKFGVSCLKLIKEDWDVIDVDHMPFYPVIFTKIVCVLKGKKMHATWNEVWGLKYWKKYIGWKGHIAYIIEKICVFLPDHIISITETTSKRLKKMLGRKNAISTISPGLNVKDIARIQPSKIASDVVYAGRLLKHKNIDLLIKAIAHLKKSNTNITAVIIGNGPEKKKLVRLAEQLGIQEHITFLDFLPKHADAIAIIKSSKLFVFPSEREGFGLVAIEANACGIPFITSNHPENAAQHLIENGNGATFELNEEALAAAIIENIETRKEQSVYIRASKKYDWEMSMSDLVYLYSV